MAKKQTQKPVILLTREGMEAAVNDYARLKLELIAEQARMEADKTAVEKRYEERINSLGRQIEDKFASVQNYCLTHRSEVLPGDKKSFETVAATVRFYNTPHRVEVRRKEKLGTLAKRLLGLVFHPDTPAELDCAKYTREADPELNKEALLADRGVLTKEQLEAMNIKFEWDEIFAIEPKSELVAAGTVAVDERAAA